MTAGRGDRRSVKIRRTGRHSSPSQVEKVAAQAGKAAPAMAIAGALVAAPQAPHALGAPAPVAAQAAQEHAAHEGAAAAKATVDSVVARTVTVSRSSAARHAALTASTYYDVRSGDTLSGIAQHYYGQAADWQWLFHENSKTVSDPNLIYTGQRLRIPATAPAHYTLSSYVPKHAAPAAAPAADSDDSASGTSSATTVAATQGSGTEGTGSPSQGSPSQGSPGGTGSAGGLSGTLGCTGLEQLWTAAGGNPADALMAAEIAMAESGGNQYALSPTNDYGYWQINASNGSLATFNAYGNARSAIILSQDGTNWNPWTTYQTGAYIGRC